MKASKITLIIQAVGMYLVHLPLYLAIILSFMPINEDLQNSLISGSLIAALVIAVLLFPLCLVNAILACVSLGKNNYNPSKVTMIIKLVLIPWYIMNFVICTFLILGFLNPWLLIAVPFLIAFLVFNTYVYMLSTSLFDITYFFHKLIKKEVKIKKVYVVSIIFLFCFCLDIIGGIIFYAQVRELE